MKILFFFLILVVLFFGIKIVTLRQFQEKLTDDKDVDNLFIEKGKNTGLKEIEFQANNITL